MAMPDYNDFGFTILQQLVINEDLCMLNTMIDYYKYTSNVHRLSKVKGILY